MTSNLIQVNDIFSDKSIDVRLLICSGSVTKKAGNASVTDFTKSLEKYNFIADAIEVVEPSVVYIEGTISNNKNSKYFPNQKSRPRNKDKFEKVSGSGFVATEDGIILTCAHLCLNLSSITVQFSDGRKYKGYVVDYDIDIDLAAIKITDPEMKFPAATLANYSDVRVGEWVIAMGSPLGLSNTVTSGIVSTLDRSLYGMSGIEMPKESSKDIHYIQTDAAINIGNSGGPLINLEGQVIGINCMTIYPATGISFAIPTDIVNKFLEQAIKIEKSFSEGGKMTSKYPKGEKFFIGISMLTLTPSILHQLPPNYFSDLIKTGVLIMHINAKSPADRSGLKIYDVIIAVNGKTVHSNSDMYLEVQKGDRMMLDVYRGIKKLVFYVEPEILSRL